MKKKISFIILITLLSVFLLSCSDGSNENTVGHDENGKDTSNVVDFSEYFIDGKSIPDIKDISEYFIDGFEPYIPYNSKLVNCLENEDMLVNRYAYKASVHSIERMYHDPTKIKNCMEGYTIRIDYSKYLSPSRHYWRTDDVCAEIKSIYGDMKIYEAEFLVDYMAYSGELRENWTNLSGYDLEFWENPSDVPHLSNLGEGGELAPYAPSMTIIMEDVVDSCGVKAKAYLYFDNVTVKSHRFRINSLSIFSENGITYVIHFTLLSVKTQDGLPWSSTEYTYLNELHISLQEKLLAELITNNVL